MNRTELDKYKAVLEAKQAELSRGLRNRDEIVIEKTPDALDEVQLAGERELAIRESDREASLLRNVRGALSRIADGSYGIRMHCGEEDSVTKRSKHCRGQASAYGARKRRTATTSRPPRPWTNRWPMRRNQAPGIIVQYFERAWEMPHARRNFSAAASNSGICTF